jgi:hypothetical protein
VFQLTRQGSSESEIVVNSAVEIVCLAKQIIRCLIVSRKTLEP